LLLEVEPLVLLLFMLPDVEPVEPLLFVPLVEFEFVVLLVLLVPLLLLSIGFWPPYRRCVLPDVPSPTPLLPLGVVVEPLLIDVSLPFVSVAVDVVPHAVRPIVRITAAVNDMNLRMKSSLLFWSLLPE
jgi:hypothetical protein